MFLSLYCMQPAHSTLHITISRISCMSSFACLLFSERFLQRRPLKKRCTNQRESNTICIISVQVHIHVHIIFMIHARIVMVWSSPSIGLKLKNQTQKNTKWIGENSIMHDILLETNAATFTVCKGYSPSGSIHFSYQIKSSAPERNKNMSNK